MRELLDDDRGQMTSTPIPVVLGVVILVGVIVFNEAQSQLAGADGPVNTCGLCHVPWWETLAALGAIAVLVVGASWVVGGPKWPPEGESDE